MEATKIRTCRSFTYGYRARQGSVHKGSRTSVRGSSSLSSPSRTAGKASYKTLALPYRSIRTQDPRIPNLGLLPFAIREVTYLFATRTRLLKILSKTCLQKDWPNGHRCSISRALFSLLMLHAGLTAWSIVYAARAAYQKRQFTLCWLDKEKHGPYPRSDTPRPRSQRSILICLVTSYSSRLMLESSMPEDL